MDSEFKSPTELMKQFRDETSRIADDRFFNDPDREYQKKREMWAAATLALALERQGIPIRVRLIQKQDDEADFELSHGGLLLRFQVTEVQKQDPPRKRGEEYKARKVEPLKPTPYEPQRGLQEGPGWIADAARKKAKKRYATAPHLLLYANFEAEDISLPEITNRCAKFRKSFPSLWIMQNQRLVQIWDCKGTRGWADKWVDLAG